MCDRRILSSGPHDYDELVSESAGAERYSRRLSERITDGYAEKFKQHATSSPPAHATSGGRAQKAVMARPTGLRRATVQGAPPDP